MFDMLLLDVWHFIDEIRDFDLDKLLQRFNQTLSISDPHIGVEFAFNSNNSFKNLFQYAKLKIEKK
jgi:hypothetical protein